MEKDKLTLEEKHKVNERLVRAILGAGTCRPYAKDLLGEREISLDEAFESILGTLSKREMRVLKLKFGLENGKWRTNKEIGQIFGVSGARIGQIIDKALRKLRHPSRSRRLRDFFIPSPE